MIEFLTGLLFINLLPKNMETTIPKTTPTKFPIKSFTLKALYDKNTAHLRAGIRINNEIINMVPSLEVPGLEVSSLEVSSLEVYFLNFVPLYSVRFRYCIRLFNLPEIFCTFSFSISNSC